MLATQNNSSDRPADRVEEFMELYTAYYRQLHVYIGSLIFNAEDVNDVLQNTSLTLWQKFSEFETGSNFLAWACTVARYQILQHCERKRGEAEVLSPEIIEILSVEAMPTAADEGDSLHHAALQECLGKLTPPDRQLIQSRYHESASVKSLAEKLSRTPSAVSHSLARIRDLLFDCVKAAVQRQERGL